MFLSNLVVEVTRRCQLECEHCLRGGSQNVDLNVDLLDEFFKKNNIDHILALTISGGEPFLNIDGINGIINTIKGNNIEIESFYFAINGIISDKNLYKAFDCVFDLVDLCGEDLSHIKSLDFMSSVDLSNEYFHIDNMGRLGLEVNKKWNLLSLFRNKYDKKTEHIYKKSSMIDMGNYNQYYGYSPGVREIKPEEVSLGYDCDNVDDTIMFNCNGRVVSDCDLSYEIQEEDDYFICNYNDDLLDGIKRHNKKLKSEEVEV